MWLKIFVTLKNRDILVLAVRIKRETTVRQNAQIGPAVTQDFV